jgi:hypothetical protein
MSIPNDSTNHNVVVEVGGIPIEIQTTDAGFESILRGRYGDYINPDANSEFTLRVQLTQMAETSNSDDESEEAPTAEVWLEGKEWRFRRGDFQACWNPATRQGEVFQTANQYSIDSVLRIIHTLLLAPQGGFLLHSSSAVRNGKAFLFSGVSEAGKTTMARLAPPDATLLTDEMSFIRKVDGRYFAYGTPFAGELAKPGENISAPIAALYLLKKAQENRIDKLEPAEAVQRLLRNILFFAHEEEMVRQVFAGACAFVAAVPVYQLSFFPDHRVWDLIG